MATPDSIEPADARELERRIGYQFQDPALLATALTHSSFRGDPGHQDAEDNERLEFLGDAILDWLVSESLYRLFPDAQEGALSRARSNLVCAEGFHGVAERLDLGRYLRIGPGEEKTGGRAKPALLANAVEALAAAIYLDGGAEAARKFVGEFVLAEIEEQGLESFAAADSKTQLQEMLQARRQSPPRYQLAASTGPDHEKTFLVELWLGDRVIAQGSGPTKKAAEQQAAATAMDALGSED